MTRGQGNDVTWTQDRISLIQRALDGPWIKPGMAAGALGVHRATVHNYMADGRLTCAHLSGSRLRSVASIDVLRLVLEEIDKDEQIGCDMGHCSRTFAARVRHVVTEHDARMISARAPNGSWMCDQPNDEHRTTNDEQTNDEQTNDDFGRE